MNPGLARPVDDDHVTRPAAPRRAWIVHHESHRTMHMSTTSLSAALAILVTSGTAAAAEPTTTAEPAAAEPASASAEISLGGAKADEPRLDEGARRRRQD